MQVQDYLRMQKYLLGSTELALAELTKDYAIKVKLYEEGLVVLNYDQINSPKSHPITMECRGLILGHDFNVVSRSMDRFFNLGEVPESQTHIDMTKATCFEKIDGSLIRIYFWDDEWHIATRGMAFAESAMNGFDVTFRELVLKALALSNEEFQFECSHILNMGVTYICEITSVENRCVKAYTGYTLHYLAARDNSTYEYLDAKEEAILLGMSLPKQYSFDSFEDCVEMTKTLKNLDEGYVIYFNGIPAAKVKSPAYIFAHRLRGDTSIPSRKNLLNLVLENENSEFLLYFPEFSELVNDIKSEVSKFEETLLITQEMYGGIIDQKQFAISIKDIVGKGFLFTARKLNKNPVDVFRSSDANQKLKVFDISV
jgi:hypothetical protein